MQLVLPRLLTAIGTAAALAACSSASGTVPAPAGSNLTPQTAARQTAASATTASTAVRTTASRHEKPELSASPSSVTFASGDSPAQTVAITGKDDNRPYDVTIAGTGNCPTIAPATLRLKHSATGHGDGDGDGDGHHGDGDGAATATITVTPNGAGPATCTITIAKHDGDAKHDGAANHPDADDDVLTIPVTVGGATPTPVPTPTPTATPTTR